MVCCIDYVIVCTSRCVHCYMRTVKLKGMAISALMWLSQLHLNDIVSLPHYVLLYTLEVECMCAMCRVSPELL